MEDFKLAQILYYQFFSEELPYRNYRQVDIDFIIEELINFHYLEHSPFYSKVIH
jgi:hypothetical protein